MNPTARIDSTISTTDDKLSQLQWQIARRADELARHSKRSRDRNSDWEYWLEAERQVLAHEDTSTSPPLLPR